MFALSHKMLPWHIRYTEYVVAKLLQKDVQTPFNKNNSNSLRESNFLSEQKLSRFAAKIYLKQLIKEFLSVFNTVYLYASLNIIKVIKSRTVRWARRVACKCIQYFGWKT
jgi:hypothetical protein